MSVRDNFDSAAGSYDQKLRQFIPDFEEFYDAILEFVPFEKDVEVRVLDLGAGTGVLSEMAAERFPRGTVTLVDFSEKMMDVARQRFAGRDHFRFVVANYLEEQFPEQYELVVSALSIHHLEDRDKQILFRKVYDSLVPGGVFVYADQTLGATPEIEERYQEDWARRLCETGVEEQALNRFLERIRDNRGATMEVPLTAQIAWLEEAGFEGVDCFYKRGRFAVCGGHKGERKGKDVTDE